MIEPLTDAELAFDCSESPQALHQLKLSYQALRIAYERTQRPHPIDRMRVDRGDYIRAVGDAICGGPVNKDFGCGRKLYDHPTLPGFEWLHRLCDGTLVKL